MYIVDKIAAREAKDVMEPSGKAGGSICMAQSGIVTSQHERQGWEAVMWLRSGRSHSTNLKHGRIAERDIYSQYKGYAKDV